MRRIADENVSGEMVSALRHAQHDVVWIRTDAPGSSDEAILARAQAEGRIVVTFDKDFGELAYRWGLAATSGDARPAPCAVHRAGCCNRRGCIGVAS